MIKPVRPTLFTAAIAAVLTVANAAYAQEDGEVIQIADLTRAEVTGYIREAEDQMYAIYNEHNIDDSFDIACRKEKPTGSNISVRICEPRFYTEVNLGKNRTDGENLQDFQGGFAARSLVAPEYEKLEADMKRVADEVPAMREIMQILGQLKARQKQLAGN
jgi:hypothetical protein